MLRFLTAGESHGKQVTAILEGMPSGLPISAEWINRQLARRQKGYGRGARQQIEQDQVLIRGGVRHGRTMGGPIALVVENKDNPNWNIIMDVEEVPEDVKPPPVTRLRPGHADFAGTIKYAVDDVRPILERASARETVTRVAVAAVCRRLLDEFGIKIGGYVRQIGQTVVPDPLDSAEPDDIAWELIERSPVRGASPEAEAAMIAAIDAARDDGDTVGGVFQVIAWNVPVGLGSVAHWDRRLDGRLAQAMMSMPAVKGVEIGGGFRVATLRGSQVHDQIRYEDAKGWTHLSNRAGGIEGGMSNGEPIIVKVAVKPISTLKNPLPSTDLATKEQVQAHFERSDVCVVPPATVVGEAMLAIVLAQAFVEKFGGDSLSEMRRNFEAYQATYAVSNKL